ncbi:MAG: PRC-barrel domain-containing protein [Ignavibacteriaceae bacterium]|jgi:sporulation protein YlmC with PRC-barrel domain
MLDKAKTLEGYKLQSLDGEIGNVKDFYFDDHYWVIRYLVADTGNWLTGKQVLISPYAMIAANKEKEHINIDLTKKQIEDSPSLKTEKPVSRQFEEQYNRHYGWPMYWGDSAIWGYYPYLKRDQKTLKESAQSKNAWDPHLRSTREVTNYNIHASDGEIGHIEDFIINTETWTIHYLIIDTRNLWPGKKVLISTQWIENIKLSESKVFVNLTRAAIKLSPEYTEEFLTREYEIALHQHYKRVGYWLNEHTTKNDSH